MRIKVSCSFVCLFYWGQPNTLSHSDEKENELITKASDALHMLGIYVNSIAENTYYIGPFRKTPERTYRYREASLDHVGVDGAYTGEILARHYRGKDKKFFQRLNKWLENHLSIKLFVEELKGDIYRITIKDLRTGVRNSIIDVGYGLSQVLPIIVQAHNPRPHVKNFWNLGVYLYIIEQPELHLHPAAQCDLADMFIEATKRNNRCRYVIETHSEHLILRLRRRIADRSISKDNVVIYYVSNDKETDKVKKLTFEADGTIPEWPDGFFDQAYEEVFAIKSMNKLMKGEPKW